MNPLSLILALIGWAIGETLARNADENAAAGAKPVEANVVDEPAPPAPVAPETPAAPATGGAA